ncbi:MAG TPA: GNAT family N-acetyltransferase, partial [Ideonella sp.]|nr:GNAT family N-acetyltransferase [Ideonella sp.]
MPMAAPTDPSTAPADPAKNAEPSAEPGAEPSEQPTEERTGERTGELSVTAVGDPASLDAAEWNALLARQPSPTPFLRHEYLLALHASGSAVPDTGWMPRFITVHRGSALVGATVAYLKDHSYGEYVFDWAWADAYQRHGLAYYPKLLAAVPFTPVPGSRLLADDEATRRLLLRALRSLALQDELSSAHLLFMDDADQAAATAEGWMLRSGVQFHWENRESAPYAHFPEFLASLQRDKRKKIQQERRKVVEAGVSFQVYEGTQIDEDLWSFFYRCYTRTYREHHSTPYLKREFFRQMAQTMPQHWVLFVAEQGGERIAASLLALDRERGTAWGRYWGALEPIACLHFEACYYQPLQWCIAQGLRRFEGGAQGEHKMARGLLPVATASAHWLAQPQFAQAVADFLRREGDAVAGYMEELE